MQHKSVMIRLMSTIKLEPKSVEADPALSIATMIALVVLSKAERLATTKVEY